MPKSTTSTLTTASKLAASKQDPGSESLKVFLLAGECIRTGDITLTSGDGAACGACGHRPRTRC